MSSWTRVLSAYCYFFLAGAAFSVIVTSVPRSTVAVAGAFGADDHVANPQSNIQGHSGSSEGLLSQARSLRECCEALRNEIESLKKEVDSLKKEKVSIGEFVVIENQASAKVLDVPAQAVGRDGLNIQQFTRLNGENQKWRLVR